MIFHLLCRYYERHSCRRTLSHKRRQGVTCSGNSCLLLGFNSSTMANGMVAVATFQIAAKASTAAGSSIPASGGAGEPISIEGFMFGLCRVLAFGPRGSMRE